MVAISLVCFLQYGSSFFHFLLSIKCPVNHRFNGTQIIKIVSFGHIQQNWLPFYRFEEHLLKVAQSIW